MALGRYHFMHFATPAKTTQTVPSKVSVKLSIQHYEKGDIDDESQKLRNYGQMWKNEQEKFYFRRRDINYVA